MFAYLQPRRGLLPRRIVVLDENSQKRQDIRHTIIRAMSFRAK